MMNIEPTHLNNVIDVDMGECVILEGGMGNYLETYGLGPCVGVAVVIRTVDGKVHRLLGHIIMEEDESYSFDELKECSKRIKERTNGTMKDIEISFTTTQSYRNRSNLTEDEMKLLRIIRNEFNFNLRDIRFNYSEQVQISPDGLISNYFERDENYKHSMK